MYSASFYGEGFTIVENYKLTWKLYNFLHEVRFHMDLQLFTQTVLIIEFKVRVFFYNEKWNACMYVTTKYVDIATLRRCKRFPNLKSGQL